MEPHPILAWVHERSPRLRARWEHLRAEVEVYCEDRNPWVRLPLALYLALAGVGYVRDPLHASWFSGITLVFHEMGHIAFIPFGRTLTILGGSIFQLAIPTAAALYLLLKQEDWFGFAVGKSWLAFAAWELATYIDDANKERLPLVSMGAHAKHDWATLLTEWHVLNYCEAFATVVRVCAFGIWVAALALMGFMFYRMFRNPSPRN